MVIRDGIRSDAFKILILLSPFPFEIYYINVKGGLKLAKVDLASTVIGTFEGFSFSKLLNPFTPTPFFERTA